MDEHSFLEKDGASDNSIAKRLSESRPLFKPVLVKDILAEHDGDDDDSDDEQIINSDNSDEESIDLDGCQPLSDEAGNDISDESKENQIENQVFHQPAHQEHVIQHAYNRNSGDYPGESKIAGKSKEMFDKVFDQELAAEHSHYKSAADYAAKKTDSYPADFSVDKPLKISRSSDEMVATSESAYSSIKLQSQYQYADERKLARDQSQCKHSLQNIVMKQDIEIKEEEHHKKYVTKQKSTEVQQKIPHNNMHASDTPMKHPHITSRPNPSTSHRNIFQTPQNKAGNEFSKNSLQTPATIFSHSWHKQHMAQTPMQNQLSSRDSARTPAASSMVSQTSRETPRIYGSEHKSVRRPLAETMGSSQAYGPQLPRLQEVPNESQMTPPLSQETSSASRQGNLLERKSMYKSTISNQEINDNRHSNSDKIKSEANINIQQNLSAPDSSHSSNSFDEMKPKKDQHNNAYQSSKKLPRVTDNYNNYPPRESHNMQPVAQTKTSQSEPVPKIQCTVPQKDTRQSKVITVKDRQYLVLGVLGTGMSCQVVRAQDLSTSELRAIKCVNLNKMDREAAEGCLQEICMLDKLKAPCIVHMYDFEIKAPWVHVVMEIGDTDLSRLLKSMLQEKKQIPLTMALYYWTEMLTAVEHIHKNGVIHSDLKPANFLLVRGRLKLIDFGIASTINSDMTSVVKNSTIGTLNYISPEALMDVNAGSSSPTSQCNKYKINHKSDVWSLGCILYGLVYGATPFHHIRQQWAKLSAITDPKHKINYPPNNGTETVPKILIDVMKKCLQHEPKARPSVTDLLKVPYLQSNIARPVPQIPSTILMKIREALTEEEWNTLTEVLLEKKR